MYGICHMTTISNDFYKIPSIELLRNILHASLQVSDLYNLLYMSFYTLFYLTKDYPIYMCVCVES